MFILSHNRLFISISCLSMLLFSACQIEESELLSWQHDDRGHLKIASYVLDVHRPIESRKKGISILANGRHYDDILSLYKHMMQLEQDSEAQAAFLAEELISILKGFLAETSPEKQTVAAELAFFLLSLEAPRQSLVIQKNILTTLTQWSLGYIRSGRDVILPAHRKGMSNVKEAWMKPKELLLSLLHVTRDIDQSQGIFDIVKADLTENISKADYAIRIHQVVHELRNPKMTEQMAELLLAAARKTYPESMTQSMVDSMIENQNKTLLRFLIEIGRDRSVDFNILTEAINKAADRLFDLGLQEETLPIFYRVLSSPNAYAKMIFRALRWSWMFGTEKDVTTILKKITPDFSAPVSGTDMKKEVENFCVQFVEKKKDKVREPLLNLLIELKDQPELWPARLYTLACINLLFPDDFPKVMKKNGLYQRYYKRDQKKISAWRSDGSVSMGEITDDFMNPMR